MTSDSDFLSKPVALSDPMFSKGLDFPSNQRYEAEPTYSTKPKFSSPQVYPSQESLESNSMFTSVQEIAADLGFTTPQVFSNEQLYSSDIALSQRPMFSEELSSLSADDTSSKASDILKADFSKKLVEIGDTTLDAVFSQEPTISDGISLEEAISVLSPEPNIVPKSNNSTSILDLVTSSKDFNQTTANLVDVSNIDMSPGSVSTPDLFREPQKPSDKIISLDAVISNMYPDKSLPLPLGSKTDNNLSKVLKKCVTLLEANDKKSKKCTRPKVKVDTKSKSKLKSKPGASTTTTAKTNSKDKKKKKKKKTTTPSDFVSSQNDTDLNNFISLLNKSSSQSNDISNSSQIKFYSSETVIPSDTCYSSPNTKQEKSDDVGATSEEHVLSLNDSLFDHFNIPAKPVDPSNKIISLEDAISAICAGPKLSSEAESLPESLPQDSIFTPEVIISLAPFSQEQMEHINETNSIKITNSIKSEPSDLDPPEVENTVKSSENTEVTKFCAVKFYPTKRSGGPPILERSSRGNAIITLAGRRFSKQKTLRDGSITRWFCSTHAPNGCKAYLHTVGNTIVKCFNKHNHRKYHKEEKESS